MWYFFVLINFSFAVLAYETGQLHEGDIILEVSIGRG